MRAGDLLALLPLLVLAGASVVVMLAIAIRRSHLVALWLTLVGLGATLASLPAAALFTPRQVTPLLVVDRFALFYIGLIMAATFAVALLAYDYLEKQEGNREELYLLLLLAAIGSAVLVTSNHFASFFLGLEILSVSLYALNAYLRARRIALEAGIKYLVLASSSAAFLLFGMALIYAELGTMSFPEMGALLASPIRASKPGLHLSMLLPGLALLITGIGFKLGVVPFHLWTPDVYQGAAAPVTAFIATVSKGSMFALLVRYFYRSGALQYPAIFLVLSVIAIASMFAGNLLALFQNNVKRILAYSSIAHLGYLLVAFLAGRDLAVQAVTFYLVAYFVTTLGAFGVVTVLSDGRRDAEDLEDYRGLYSRRPALAGIFTAMLLSLAGIPLTAGFLGKFYIVAAGASASIWSLLVILAVTSVVGLFYYLRIVVAVFSAPTAAALPSPLAATGMYTLAVLTVLLIWFGVYPHLLLRAIQAAAAGLT